MPVVLVKIPPTEAGKKVGNNMPRQPPPPCEAMTMTVQLLDACDQLDGPSAGILPSLDDDFSSFQAQAETLAMREGDGTTVIAATIPAVEASSKTAENSAVVQEIVVAVGDASALIESTLEHSSQHSSGQTSISLRKLAANLKDAESWRSTALPPHPMTDLEERVLQQGRFVSPADFSLLKVIGMGAFGKVLQVRSKVTQQVLAMKVISKRKLKSKNGYIENVKAERDIMTRVRHPVSQCHRGRHTRTRKHTNAVLPCPAQSITSHRHFGTLTFVVTQFVVGMHCSFQSKEKLFILMDFLAGGELFLRIGREGIFLEKTAAFYLAEIILALDHLHSLGILHRGR
jgi:p70 ribosomal S6 kinase